MRAWYPCERRRHADSRLHALAWRVKALSVSNKEKFVDFPAMFETFGEAGYPAAEAYLRVRNAA